jgi:hypothetical protein
MAVSKPRKPLGEGREHLPLRRLLGDDRVEAPRDVVLSHAYAPFGHGPPSMLGGSHPGTRPSAIHASG